MVKLIKSIQRSRSWDGSPGATSRAVCNWKSEVNEEARSAPGSCSQDDSAAWLTLYCPQCWRGWTGPDMTLVLIHNFFSAGFVHWYQRAQTWQDIALTEWKRQKGMQGNGRVIVWFIRVILILTKVGILISTWFQVVPFGLRFSKQSLFLMYDPSFCCP